MVGSNDINPPAGPGSLITPTAVGSCNTVTLSRLLLLELLQFLSFLFLHFVDTSLPRERRCVHLFRRLVRHLSKWESGLLWSWPTPWPTYLISFLFLQISSMPEICAELTCALLPWLDCSVVLLSVSCFICKQLGFISQKHKVNRKEVTAWCYLWLNSGWGWHCFSLTQNCERCTALVSRELLMENSLLNECRCFSWATNWSRASDCAKVCYSHCVLLPDFLVAWHQLLNFADGINNWLTSWEQDQFAHWRVCSHLSQSSKTWDSRKRKILLLV